MYRLHGYPGTAITVCRHLKISGYLLFRSNASASPRIWQRSRQFSGFSGLLDDSSKLPQSPPPNFDDDEPELDPSSYSSLPRNFGTNQHMYVDDALKESLRSVLWQFRAPVRYAFAYGSGVFPQGMGAPLASKKPMIDLIFGVTYTQHWHSINFSQHPEHYSFLGKMGSRVLSHVQDDFGPGVYFNPYVDINGTLVKYGVVNIDTLCRDLTEWDTLYLAGRLHKPVKILRDEPRVRLAKHINLLSAVRVALLLLPEEFTEYTLYSTITGISYMGDPRMKLFTENPHKVRNIVSSQLPHFRRLYSPLIEQLPNVRFLAEKVSWNDHASEMILIQDMDPQRRANMVRRLPRAFREKLYFQYQRTFAIPTLDFERMVDKTRDEEMTQKKQGGEFEQRIAKDTEGIRGKVSGVIKSTIIWPSTVQSLKGLVTAGPSGSWRYLREKVEKWEEGRKTG